MPMPRKYHSREEKLAAKRRMAKADREADPEKHRSRLRAWHNLNKYGITVEQRDALLVSQGGRCALPHCRREITFCGKGLAGAHVDHIHGSDPVVVRGILCMSCNQALGKLGDSVDSIAKVLEYLKRGEAA